MGSELEDLPSTSSVLRAASGLQPYGLHEALEDLRSDSRGSRRSAVAYLAEEGVPHIPHLVVLLTDPDPRFRFHIERSLINYGDAAVEALAAAAAGDEQTLCCQAVITLARVDTPRAADALRSVIDAMSRSANTAAYYLALRWTRRLGPVSCLTLLLDATRDNRDGRSYALRVLFALSPDEGWPRCIVLDDSATLEQRYHALEMLTRAPAAIRKWTHYDNIVMRDLCSQLLGDAAFQSLRDILRRLQEDDDAAVRQAAIDLIAWRDLPRPVETAPTNRQLLRSATEEPSPDILLRAGSAPDTSAPLSLWQRLRARFTRARS